MSKTTKNSTAKPGNFSLSEISRDTAGVYQRAADSLQSVKEAEK